VILNSGLMHRVGASRTSVKLSRALVNDGYIVLRFDLSNIGDSEVRAVGMDPEDRIVEEVSAAMDFLENQYQIDKFVLYGLCSGAQNSFKTAIRDSRVIGLAGVDNFGFRTKRYYFEHYKKRFLKAERWKNFVANIFKKNRKLFGKLKSAGTVEPEEDLWPYPPKEFVEQGYKKLVRRGVKFLYIYTGSWENQYNYLNQFFDMYPSVDFKNVVDLKFKPQYMINSVAQWLKPFC